MRLRIFVNSIIGGAILFIAVLLFGIWKFGSLGAVVAYSNGDSVYLIPKNLNLGKLEAGSQVEAVFTLQNLTSDEISVVGEKSSCNCAFSEYLPLVASPGKKSLRQDKG